ncbi:MAG: alpha/beta hydrolase [Sciscionella sp.]
MTSPISTLVRASDGTGLAVTESGRGDPLLFIAGLGYASWSWTRQVSGLASRFRVVTADNRGTGGSDKPPGLYSVSLMADDMAAVIDSLGTGFVHVVGASMGGYIAMTLARRHPDLVRSLTLIATSAGGPGSIPVPDSTKRAWAQAAEDGPEGFARATMPLAFRPNWSAQHPDQAEQLLQMRLAAPTPQAAWQAQFEACEEFLRAGLPPGAVVEQPTLIMHGTADRIVPFDNAAHLCALIPDARFVCLEEAGHLCWIEQADRVNELISAHVLSAPPCGERR